MNAKALLFTQVLEDLKKSRAYFTHQAIQMAANEAELDIKDEVLNVYLSQAVKQGLIHDAGRGWYSRLSAPVKLDLQPVAKLVKALDKAFPLLDFTVWSTEQLNPWMHHMVARPVTFLYSARDTLESVADTLRDQGWEVSVHPGKRESSKTVRPGEKMVVLRPTHSMQPAGAGHQASVEQVLVELPLEAATLSLMDVSEAEAAAASIAVAGLVQIPLIQRFARFKRAKIDWIDSINQRNIF